MRIYFFISLALLLPRFVFAQLTFQWERSMGGTLADYAQSVQPTSDGGYILSGYSFSNDVHVSGHHGAASWDDCWVVKLNKYGGIEWQRSLGGSSTDRAASVIQTSDGGYIVAANTMSNDGDVTGNHGIYDSWIVKLDASGNIQWQKCYGGPATDRAMAIQQTIDGGYVFAGQCETDGGDVSGSHGGLDCWAVKIDAVGNLQWQKPLGGTDGEGFYSIKQTSDGGYILAGETSSDDGDVTGQHWVGSPDCWVVKLDAGGNLQWQKALGGQSWDWAYGVVQAQDGNYVIAGHSSSHDGDVTGVHPGNSDVWIAKIDSSSGSVIWQKALGGSLAEKAYSLIQTSDGSLIMLGTSESIDNDVTGHHGNQFDEDIWLMKVDGNGNFKGQLSLGGAGNDEGRSIAQTADGGFVIAGYISSGFINIPNSDISRYIGSLDCWIAKLGPGEMNVNTITGNLFLDFNSNSIHDAGELDLKNHKVKESVTGMTSFTLPNGSYTFYPADTGNYQVIPAAFVHFPAAPAQQTAYFSSMNIVDSLNDFAFQPDASVNDLRIHISPATPFRPGRYGKYSLKYKNVGTSVLNASLVFYPDVADLVYNGASVPPSIVTTDSLVWSNITVNPFQEGTIDVGFNVNTGSVAGTKLSCSAKIEPVTGDDIPSDNVDSNKVVVIASMDPNDKIVSIDSLTESEIDSGIYLDYVIHFQNTGNDTAFTIYIQDTIAPNLNMNTFELVNSSHDVQLQYVNALGMMRFQFTNILLTDSNIDESGSHGFVHYRIQPASPITSLEISNHADIYFDYNEPVTTNSAITTIQSTVGIKSDRSSENSIRIFPNPIVSSITVISLITSFHEVQLRNICGELVYSTIPNSNRVEIDLQKLPSGVYFLSVMDEENVLTVKKVVKM